MQQATVNLFADMGAQPYALISGLTAATASTDTTAPTSTITSPASGRDHRRRRQDHHHRHRGGHRGGVVAGVEVSTDGGTTWHPATGTTSWTYSWVAHGNPTRDHQVPGGRRQRQHRDAVRRGSRSTSPAPARSGAPARRPAPATPGAPRAVEVGVKFTSDVSGIGDRHPVLQGRARTPAPTSGTCGPPPGRSWRRRPSPARRASGWQQVTFATPVPINAEHHLRRVLLRPGRAHRPGRGVLLPEPRRRSPDGNSTRRQPSAARAAQHERHAERPVPEQQHEHLPDEQHSTRGTTGST